MIFNDRTLNILKNFARQKFGVRKIQETLVRDDAICIDGEYFVCDYEMRFHPTRFTLTQTDELQCLYDDGERIFDVTPGFIKFRDAFHEQEATSREPNM